jgi:tetratricopeptide (TPR) repeat protein
MNKSAYIRFSITLLLLFSLLSPTAVLAGDGKKHYKEGKKAEDAEQWDKAAEEYALAVTDSPKNPEYLLHYRRSLFMASQMYMKRGTSLAQDKDYAGGYLAFRKAYAYDPTNELAKSEMERMLRLQQAVENGDKPDTEKTPTARSNSFQPVIKSRVRKTILFRKNWRSCEMCRFRQGLICSF